MQKIEKLINNIQTIYIATIASRAKISNMDRMRAIILHEQGHSMRKIAEELKRSVSCVHRLVSRFEETKSIQDRHRSGRPPVSTPHDDRVLARIQKKTEQGRRMR